MEEQVEWTIGLPCIFPSVRKKMKRKKITKIRQAIIDLEKESIARTHKTIADKAGVRRSVVYYYAKEYGDQIGYSDSLLYRYKYLIKELIPLISEYHGERKELSTKRLAERIGVRYGHMSNVLWKIAILIRMKLIDSDFNWEEEVEKNKRIVSWDKANEIMGKVVELRREGVVPTFKNVAEAVEIKDLYRWFRIRPYINPEDLGIVIGRQA